jgi:hypothetical protein
MPISYSNPRQAAISNLIERAFANPLVDDAEMVALFESMAVQVMTFERTGADTLTPALQAQVDSMGPFRQFLLGYADEDGTLTVFDAIKATLAGV